jgi:hypothetical protein
MRKTPLVGIGIAVLIGSWLAWDSVPGVAGRLDRAVSGSSQAADLYVDGLRGDDSGNCHAPASPCRTIQRAIDRIPLWIRADVTVHIAPGVYEEEVVIADRVSPEGRTLTLSGDPGLTLLEGGGARATGISVTRSARVVLEDLIVTRYSGSGIDLFATGAVALVRTVSAEHGGHGIRARLTDVTVRGGVVRDNGGSGISLEQAWLRTEPDPSGERLLAGRNRESGLRACASQVVFGAAAKFEQNGVALLAEHGAQVNLNRRDDVVLVTNSTMPGPGRDPVPDEPRRDPAGTTEGFLRGCEMLADHHGVILGFSRASVQVSCVRGETGLGLCSPD